MSTKLTQRLSKKAEIATYVLITLLVALFLFYIIPRLIDLKYASNEVAYGEDVKVFTADNYTVKSDFNVKSDKLRWSPPQGWQNYERISWSEYKGGPRNSCSDTGNYIIEMPDYPIEENLRIKGGGNIVIIGGEVHVPFKGDNATESTRSGIRIIDRKDCDFSNPRVVFIEGVRVGELNKRKCVRNSVESNCSDLTDGIQIDSRRSTVVLQNIRVEDSHVRVDDEVDGLNGHPRIHPDVIQTFGGVVELRVDRFTGSTDYQGLMLKNDFATGNYTHGDMFFSRVNIKGSTDRAYGYWDSYDDRSGEHFWEDVYLDFNRPICLWKNSSCNHDYWINGTKDGKSTVEIQNNNFNPDMNGFVYDESPSNDFVPSWVPGTDYVSPGYQDGTIGETSTSGSTSSGSTGGQTNSDLNIVLYDSSVNTPVDGFNPMDSNETLNLKDFSSNNFGFTAEIDSTDVNSIKFSGTLVDKIIGSSSRIENVYPYSVFGDTSNNIIGKKLEVGQYILTVEAYSSSGGNGSLLASHTVTLNVIDDEGGDDGGSGVSLDEDLKIILYNTDTNLPVRGFNPMDNNETLDLQNYNGNKFGFVVEAESSNVKSVEFSGSFSRTENLAPYSVFGDVGDQINGRSLSPGTYTITAKSFTNSGGDGSEISSETVTLEVINGGGDDGGDTGESGSGEGSDSELELYLIDPNTDNPVPGYDPIQDNTIINLANLNGSSFGFEARSSRSNVESIRFDGDFGLRVENVYPYSHFGDTNGNFETTNLVAGNYEINLTSFTGNNQSGSILDDVTINFSVINESGGSSTGGENPTGYEVTLSTRDRSVASSFKMRTTSNSVYQSYTTSNIGDAGTLELDFNLEQSGNYKIIGKVKTEGSNDEVWINMNNNPTSNRQIWEIGTGSGTREVEVSWPNSNPKIFNLNSGQNTLIVKGKEKNVHMYEFTLVRVN